MIDMGVNQVFLSNGETILDLSKDSVTEKTLAYGETAHNAAGEPITGNAKLCTVTLDVADAAPTVEDRSIITFVVG